MRNNTIEEATEKFTEQEALGFDDIKADSLEYEDVIVERMVCMCNL